MKISNLFSIVKHSLVKRQVKNDMYTCIRCILQKRDSIGIRNSVEDLYYYRQNVIKFLEPIGMDDVFREMMELPEMLDIYDCFLNDLDDEQEINPYDSESNDSDNKSDESEEEDDRLTSATEIFKFNMTALTIATSILSFGSLANLFMTAYLVSHGCRCI